MKHLGLSHSDAERLLVQFGKNEIRDISHNTPLMILLRQVRNNPVLYLLFVAMVLSFLVGKVVTGYTILVVILMVVGAGFVQEYRAEESLKALKRMIMPVSLVIRDGREVEVDSSLLVPGDLVVLRSGEKIPSDCLILEQKELLVNESVLTGESREVSKIVFKGKGKYTDENLLFMGSFLVSGKCLAKVLHTGMNTRFGRIAGLISSAEKDLPLQRKLNRLVKYMSITAISVSLLTGVILLFNADSYSQASIVDVLILVIALSVSAFPEGLPVVLTTTLASGVHRMAKKNAIVNRMSVIEALGETTVICSDKTGTITKGEMTVKRVFCDNAFFDVEGSGYSSKGNFLRSGKKVVVSRDKTLSLLCNTAVLCNDSRIERVGKDDVYRPIGTPTEAALLVMSAKAGLFKDDVVADRVEEVPFSSERKMMSVMVSLNGRRMVFVKGAPELLLKRCVFVRRGSGVFKLTVRERSRISKAMKSMTDDSYRTIAFAYKDKVVKGSSLDEKLVFLGVAGLEDPPRDEVKDALRTCFNAGIAVKMITGDNRETAVSVARQIGLKGRVVEGDELEVLTDDELQRQINSIVIFARVKPIHKLRIVKALKANGEVVTMTGDGVNDAPALKEAHIGIAMGRNGTDVSREVADITLKDDNFVTIVEAIREGRTIFRNIRKFVTYQLSCNLGELSILFVGSLFAPLLGWEIPVLLALQILFMNLVTDNLPAITLGFNNASSDIMGERPRRNAQILSSGALRLLFFTGGIIALLTLLAVFLSFNIFGSDFVYARTDGLIALILLEIASAFNFRSFRKPVLSRSLLVNPYLFYTSAISVVATVLIVYTPLSGVFGVAPISFVGWLIALIPAFFLIVLFDVFKHYNNKKKWLVFDE